MNKSNEERPNQRNIFLNSIEYPAKNILIPLALVVLIIYTFVQKEEKEAIEELYRNSRHDYSELVQKALELTDSNTSLNNTIMLLTMPFESNISIENHLNTLVGVLNNPSLDGVLKERLKFHLLMSYFARVTRLGVIDNFGNKNNYFLPDMPSTTYVTELTGELAFYFEDSVNDLFGFGETNSNYEQIKNAMSNYAMYFTQRTGGVVSLKFVEWTDQFNRRNLLITTNDLQGEYVLVDIGFDEDKMISAYIGGMEVHSLIPNTNDHFPQQGGEA